jgi:hypothetical protein
MLKLSLKHPSYGYRRITILLREDSWLVNFKRVYRLWCQEGLKVPKKQHKRLYAGTSANSCDKKKSEHYNHVWSYDFLTERLENGKRVQQLAVAYINHGYGPVKVERRTYQTSIGIKPCVRNNGMLGFNDRWKTL